MTEDSNASSILQRQSKHLALALSGGGLRATFFHLGVVAYLRATEQLASVSVISAVSGGSILAGHMVRHWDRYTGTVEEFVSASAEVVRLGRLSLRTRITKKWIITRALLFGFFDKYWSLSRLLQRELDFFFGKVLLRDLPEGGDRAVPKLRLVATNFSTGALCCFGRDYFRWFPLDDARVAPLTPIRTSDLPLAPTTPLKQGGPLTPIRTGDLPLSFAVAASACFPPVFPPFRMDAGMLSTSQKMFGPESYLSDGGVLDNLGLIALREVSRSGEATWERTCSCDASRALDADFEEKFRTPWSIGGRAFDLMSSQGADFTSQVMRASLPDIVPCALRTTLDDRAQPLAVQHEIQNMRTDLDRVTWCEIEALMVHGWQVAETAFGVSPAAATISGITPPLIAKALDSAGGHKRHAVEAKRLSSARQRRFDSEFFSLLAALQLWILAPAIGFILWQRTEVKQARSMVQTEWTIRGVPGASVEPLTPATAAFAQGAEFKFSYIVHKDAPSGALLRDVRLRYELNQDNATTTGEAGVPAGDTASQQLEILLEPGAGDRAGVVSWKLVSAGAQSPTDLPLVPSAGGESLLPHLVAIIARPGEVEQIAGTLWLRTPGKCVFWLDFIVTVAGEDTKRSFGPFTCIY